MEILKQEIEAVESVAVEFEANALRELSEIALALVGGGSGDISLG